MNIFETKMNNFLDDMEGEIRSTMKKNIIDVVHCGKLGQFAPINLSFKNEQFILTCEETYMFNGATRYKDIMFKRGDLTLGDWFNVYNAAIETLNKN